MSTDRSFFLARATDGCRFEQKLTRSEYEQLVHAVATQRRCLLQDMRRTDVSVMDVLVDPSRMHTGALLKAVEDSSAENNEQRIVELLRSVT